MDTCSGPILYLVDLLLISSETKDKIICWWRLSVIQVMLYWSTEQRLVDLPEFHEDNRLLSEMHLHFSWLAGSAGFYPCAGRSKQKEAICVKLEWPSWRRERGLSQPPTMQSWGFSPVSFTPIHTLTTLKPRPHMTSTTLIAPHAWRVKSLHSPPVEAFGKRGEMFSRNSSKSSRLHSALWWGLNCFPWLILFFSFQPFPPGMSHHDWYEDLYQSVFVLLK